MSDKKREKYTTTAASDTFTFRCPWGCVIGVVNGAEQPHICNGTSQIVDILALAHGGMTVLQLSERIARGLDATLRERSHDAWVTGVNDGRSGGRFVGLDAEATPMVDALDGGRDRDHRAEPMSDEKIQVELTKEVARKFLREVSLDRDVWLEDVRAAVADALPPEHPEGAIAWLTLDNGHRYIAFLEDGMWKDGPRGETYRTPAQVEPLRVLADDEYAYVIPDSPKMLRETLCVAQSRIGNSPYDEGRKREHIDRLQRLIDDCDRHRPVGPDGKHGDRHTSTCGCKR